MFSYQKETGLSPDQIMKMPYIQFVISMLDAPEIDTDAQDKDKVVKAKTKEEEIAAINAALM